MKKKPSKRSKVKYASLIPRFNSKIRQEYLDYDYLDKLSEAELEFLADFTAEWNNAEVGKQSEARKNRFHRTKKQVKDCTDRNNQRNGDVYGASRAKRALQYIPSDGLNDSFLNQAGTHNEDALIKVLDLRRKERKNTASNRNKRKKKS